MAYINVSEQVLQTQIQQKKRRLHEASPAINTAAFKVFSFKGLTHTALYVHVSGKIKHPQKCPQTLP